MLRFMPPRATTFRRKVWYYKLADCDKYREELSEATLLQISKLITKSTKNIQDNLETILNAADKSIPNKL